MNKKETIELLTLIKIIESDINIHEDLLKNYEVQGKENLYYFGIANEKKDRLFYLKNYLKRLKNLYSKEN